MPTQCNTKPLEFEPHGRRRVVADFDGGPRRCRGGDSSSPCSSRGRSVPPAPLDGGSTPRLDRTVTGPQCSRTDSGTALKEGDLWGDHQPLDAK